MSIQALIADFSRYVHRISDVDVCQMAGLAEGTNAATLKTTNQIIYGIYNTHGIIKAATDNIAMTACAQQAISTFCYYLVSINVSGAVTVTKGIDNTYGLPSAPPGTVAMGAVMVTTDGSHTFTSGTTDLSITGITAVCYDIDTGIAMKLVNQAQARFERGVTVSYNGKQRTIQDFEYMKVRGTAIVNLGDTSVVLPFPNYKSFIEITCTDSTGLITPIEKEDKMTLGVIVQNRPEIIARLPAIETTFTKDGEPAIEFDLWPQPDQTYTIDAICYQYSAPLDGVIYSTNWLLENAPDILLFGALIEGISYFPADARADEWKARWNDAAWTMWAAQEKEAYGGDYIKTNYPILKRRQAGIAARSYVYTYGTGN